MEISNAILYTVAYGLILFGLLVCVPCFMKGKKGKGGSNCEHKGGFFSWFLFVVGFALLIIGVWT